RSPFLVIRKVGGKAQFSGDKPPDGKTFGIEKDTGAIAGFIGLRLLDDRVDNHEKIFFIYLVEISLVLIEGIPPWFFALKAVFAAGAPFRIVQQEGLQVLPVYFGDMVDLVIRIEIVQAVGQLGNTDRAAAADRLIRGDIQRGVPLLQDLHS